jgi:hypothetical protein
MKRTSSADSEVLRVRRRCGGFRAEALERRVLLSVSPNLAITSDPGVQQFPSMAADPLDPNHLVVSYMDRSLVNTGYAGIGIAVSHDAGKSWQRTSIPLPSPFNQGAANPVTRFDALGRVYVSFMAATFLGPQPPLTLPDFLNAGTNVSDRADGFQSNNGAFVAHSDDGGAHWNTPTAIVSHLYTGTPVYFETAPEIAIDTFAKLPDGSSNPRSGTIYATWTRLYPPGQFPGHSDSTGGGNILVAASKDGGQSWQTESTINDAGNTANGYKRAAGWCPLEDSHLAIGPEGDLYESNGGGGDFTVYHSTDGGASFVGDTTANYLAFGPGFLTLTKGDTLPNDNFRTDKVRAIAADPTRPGTLYATEAIYTLDSQSNVIADSANIYFARSSDYGATWTSTESVGTNKNAIVLNDDNGGVAASTLDPNAVISGQALPQLAVGANGDVSVIWYDTRRDPADHLLDVFGTVSTDGGQTFSPNFRVTDQSFDPNAGAFTDPTGRPDYYIGDGLGVTVVGRTVYAAWTDTRASSQDIEFSSFSTAPAPAPPNDRFEPNDTPAIATSLGTIFNRQLGQLTIAPGDSDWFRLQSVATGNVTASAAAADPTAGVQVEIWDGSGTTMFANGHNIVDSTGAISNQAECPSAAGETFLVHVTAVSTASITYQLSVTSLTAPPSSLTTGSYETSLAAGGQAYFLITAAADGSLDFSVTPQSGTSTNLLLDLLNPDPSKDAYALNVVASGQPDGSAVKASAAVSKGQQILVHVSGASGSTSTFNLEFANLDQFDTSQNTVRSIPDTQGPSDIAIGDLNGDTIPDLVVSNTLTNTVDAFIGNGDGTFQSPRQFDIGAFGLSSRGLFFQGIPSFGRGLALADVDHNGTLDAIVTNYSSGDVSVLLGRGDGTFAPQRRFDATSGPIAVAAASLNGDSFPDLVVANAPATSADSVLASLLGRGDGSFQPEKLMPFPLTSGGGYFPPTGMGVADFDGNGIPDVAVSVLNDTFVHIFLGNGDGTFRETTPISDVDFESALFVGDVNGDGKADIVTAMIYTGAINVFLGNGNGTFSQFLGQSPPISGQVPSAIQLADWGSQIQTSDGHFALGPPDGHPDLIVANSGSPVATPLGSPDVVVLPALFDQNGKFGGFGAPETLYQGTAPFALALGDFNKDSSKDLAFIDGDTIRLLFGGAGQMPVPNNTRSTARNLGTVVHAVEPTLTIVPGHEDAWYRLTVPTEAAAGSGNEVVDFSALFEQVGGAGLSMEVSDSAGRILGSGANFHITAGQGNVLYLHVFGLTAPGGARGAGAYTLDIDVLPQLVSVQAPPLLPGSSGAGSANTLVLTFQGDRLDPVAAQDPSNYRVIWLGRGRKRHTQLPAAVSVVYDPSANIDVATGVTYPTAVRQTVTLVFASPLAAGSYRVTIAPLIHSQALSQDETTLLSGGGHPLVQLKGKRIAQGASLTRARLVTAAAGSFTPWTTGTPFLTQMHDDLGSLLDSSLNQTSDDPNATSTLLQQIVSRVEPTFPGGQGAAGVLFLWLDPPSSRLDNPFGSVVYDQANNIFSNTLTSTYVSVAGNVELFATPMPPGQSLTLTLQGVSSTARGGAVVLWPGGDNTSQMTNPLRLGQTTFTFQTDSYIPMPTVTVNPTPTTPPTSDPGSASSLLTAAEVYASNITDAPPPHGPNVASPENLAVASTPPAAANPAPTGIGKTVAHEQFHATAPSGPLIETIMDIMKSLIDKLKGALRRAGVRSPKADAAPSTRPANELRARAPTSPDEFPTSAQATSPSDTSDSTPTESIPTQGNQLDARFAIAPAILRRNKATRRARSTGAARKGNKPRR